MLTILQQQNICIIFAWAKGHSGIAGNESVDKFAKEAIQNGNEITGLQFYDLFPIFKENMHNLWKNQYANYAANNRNRYTRTYSTLVSKPSIQFEGLNRNTHVTLFRAISGHGNIKYLLHKMGLSEGSLCDCNNPTVDDFNHWLLSCTYNRMASKHMIEELAKLNLLPINFETIINIIRSDKKVYNIFITFVKTCERKL